MEWRDKDQKSMYTVYSSDSPITSHDVSESSNMSINATVKAHWALVKAWRAQRRRTPTSHMCSTIPDFTLKHSNFRYW